MYDDCACCMRSVLLCRKHRKVAMLIKSLTTFCHVTSKSCQYCHYAFCAWGSSFSYCAQTATGKTLLDGSVKLAVSDSVVVLT